MVIFFTNQLIYFRVKKLLFFMFYKFFKGFILNMIFFPDFGIQRIAVFFVMLDNFSSEDLKVLQS